MDACHIFGLLLLMTIQSVWSEKWKSANRNCKRCNWFKPRCNNESDDFIKSNCYQGLFKTREKLHKYIDGINYACQHGLEIRNFLVYGERDCPTCKVIKKDGEENKVFNTGNYRNAFLTSGNVGNHPCCVTKYTLVSPTRLIDPVTGTSYTVALYNGAFQWIWFGRCENKGATCYNGGTCYELWDYPTEILVENPDNNPPYIFKEYHYPRQCVCSQ